MPGQIRVFQQVCDALGVEAKERSVRCNCPAHGGDSQSLSVRELPDGKVQLTCFSQRCERDAILAAAGLSWQDLLPDNTNHRHGVKRRASKPTDKWTQERIQGEDVWVKWDLVCAYLYLDEQGSLLYEKLRYRPEEKYRNAPEMAKKQKSFAFSRKAANGNVIWGMDGGWHEFNPKRRRWEYLRNESQHRVDEKPKDGAEWFDAPRRVLFDLPMLVSDLQSGVREVWVCEGEPDAGVLRRSLGVSSTTADAGAHMWRAEYTEFLAKFGTVVIVADNDKPGLGGAIRKRDALMAFDPAPVVRVVVPGDGKDAEEFLLKGGTREGFREIDAEAELLFWAAKEAGPDTSLESLTDSPDSDDQTPPDPPLPDNGDESSRSSREPFYFHDMDLAEAFVAERGARLRFCAKFGCWFWWDGVHWSEDLNAGSSYLDEWRPFAREQETLGRKILAEGKYPEKWLKEVKAQVGRVLSSQGARSVEGLAKQIDPIPVSPDKLDQELDLLPVANGTVDLRRGVLLPADPAHLFTSVVPVAYDAEADCPRWVQFLRESLADEEMVEYIRVAVGYWLTGRTSEHKFWFLYGPPRSGKSTFVKIVTRLQGKFFVNMMKKFVMKAGPTTTIDEHWARAKGKRLMTIAEVDHSDRWDESLLKQVTGEDVITARRLHENSYDFTATFKMLAIGNARPKVRGEDGAFWTRVLPVAFPNARSAEEQDEGLEDALVAELPGILLWALDGAKEWYERGKLWVPSSIAEEIDEYKRDSDILGKFLAACTEESGGYIKGQELFEAYQKWAKKTNSWNMNKNAFGQFMKQRTDVIYEHTREGKKLRDRMLKLEDHWDLDAE